MICRDVYRNVVAEFSRAKLDTPDMDARLLIQHVTGWSHADFILGKTDKLSKHNVDQIEDLAKRRVSGEPIDHILGYSEFYGRRFAVTKDVLSPRPETEELVERVLGALMGKSAPRVLDLGTGSGAIIVTILAECLDAQGVSVDISKAALHLAEENAKTHNVSDRLNVLQGDWFEPVFGIFDVIVSNPPYITTEAMTDLSIEVSNFDPDLALRGGDDGLEAYKVILQNAQEYLKSNGALFFEIGYDQGEAVSTLMTRAGFMDVEVSKDLAGHDRIVSGLRRDN